MGISVGALIMRVDRDRSGQMSIDFLIGVSIFILAFLFLMMALPKMFTPFQSNSDELTMIADRVGATLIEDTLAMRNAAGEPIPGVIDVARIKALNNELDKPHDEDTLDYRKSLGLDNGNMVYHLTVKFMEYTDDGSDFVPAPDYRKIPKVNTIEPGSQNVGQSRRFAYVRDSAKTAVELYPGYKAIVVVRVW